MKTRLVPILLAIGLVCILVGCSNSSAGTSSAKQSSTKATNVDGATYNITLAAAVQKETAMYRTAEQFKANVEKRTNNKVTVNLVFGGVLGGDREMVDSLTNGTIQMAFATDIGYATCYPEIGYVNLPFLFPNYDAVDKYYFNGFLGEKLKEQLLQRNIRLVSWGENDYRSLTSNHPIKTLADLKGMKIRVPEFPSLLAYFKKLGANPTPMAFTELLTALQQHTVDGQDNGPILTYTSKLYEAQKYFTWTNHVYSGAGIGINEKFFQSLPREYQTIIAEEGKAAGDLQIKMNRENVSDCIKKMEAAGIVVSQLTPELAKVFKEAAPPIWDQFKDKYDAKIMEYIMKNLI